jgi:hypothetical protein
MVENESISGEGLELFWWLMLLNMPGAIIFFFLNSTVFVSILTLCKQIERTKLEIKQMRIKKIPFTSSIQYYRLAVTKTTLA